MGIGQFSLKVNAIVTIIRGGIIKILVPDNDP